MVGGDDTLVVDAVAGATRVVGGLCVLGAVVVVATRREATVVVVRDVA